MNYKRWSITAAKNGFLVQAINDYANFVGEPEVFMNFEDAVAFIAKQLCQEKFAATVKQSQALTVALTDFVSLAVAPQLLAIEAKVNPGVENLVGEDVEF